MATETKPALRTGMTVKVYEKIKDITPKGEERLREQIFEGIILGMRGSGTSSTIRVLKDADGWKVEKIFPVNSPNVAKIEVVRQMKVRHAKIDFMKRTFDRKLRERGAKRVLKAKKEPVAKAA